MTNFDDFDSEPEDAWDADDSIEEQIDNLRRRVILLAAVAATQSGWDEHERTRARLIDEDFQTVLRRLLES